MNITVNLSSQIKAAKEKKVLNKPFRTPKGPKKFAVYVKNDKGNIVKVNFGDPNMEIKRDDPERRKSFRARHKCDVNPGPRWKAKYWSCKMWESKKSVTDLTSKGSIEEIIHRWDGLTYWRQEDLLALSPSLANSKEVIDQIEEADEYTEEIIEDAYQMALDQLAFINDSSLELLNKLRSNPKLVSNLEPWVQCKITIIEDYIASISNYISEDKGELNIEEEDKIREGVRIINVNASSIHFGSEGIIRSINNLPDNIGKVVTYEVINDAKNYKKGDFLKKTIDQLQYLEASQDVPREGLKTKWNIIYKTL